MGTCLVATDSAAVNIRFYLTSATCDCVVYRLSYNWTLVKSLVDHSAQLSARYRRSEKTKKVRGRTLHHSLLCFEEPISSPCSLLSIRLHYQPRLNSNQNSWHLKLNSSSYADYLNRNILSPNLEFNWKLPENLFLSTFRLNELGFLL